MRAIATLWCVMLVTLAGAQTEYSAFTLTGRGVASPFATDYQALGINPANLHWEPAHAGKNWTMGFFETSFSLFSDALTKDELRRNLRFQEFETLTPQERKAAIADFTDSRWTADFDMMQFGIAYRNDAIGGFAFSTQDRVDVSMKLGKDAADIMFNGFTADYFDTLVLEDGTSIANDDNVTQAQLDQVVLGIPEDTLSVAELMEGTDIEMSWIRAFNLGFGRAIVNTPELGLYGGIGLKYLMGLANVSIRAEDGMVSGFSATTPFLKIDYGEAQADNPSAIEDSGMVPVGNGFGVDLGVSAVIKEKLRLAASVNDIGSMTWDGNVYALRDTVLTSTEEPGVETLSLVDQLKQFMENEDAMEWEGDSEYSTQLPTTLRLGASWQPGEMVNVGAEIILPLNDEPGNLDQEIIAVGGELRPLRWLGLNLGFITGGNYDAKIPAGVTFTVADGGYELGFASRDLITFFTDKQPTASLSFGFMRFRW